MGTPVDIVAFDDRYAAEFARLNRTWLEGYGLMEELDEHFLRNPRANIIDGGGEIFLALQAGSLVGTCGVHPTGDGVFELVKLTVDVSLRGQGLGRRLTERVLDFARAAGARKVVLCSNARLTSAVRLYESMGFQHRPVPADIGFVNADVYMELEL